MDFPEARSPNPERLRGVVRWAFVRAQIDVEDAAGNVVATHPVFFAVKGAQETRFDPVSFAAAHEFLETMRGEYEALASEQMSDPPPSSLNPQPHPRPAWLKLLSFCLPFLR